MDPDSLNPDTDPDTDPAFPVNPDTVCGSGSGSGSGSRVLMTKKYSCKKHYDRDFKKGKEKNQRNLKFFLHRV